MGKGKKGEVLTAAFASPAPFLDLFLPISACNCRSALLQQEQAESRKRTSTRVVHAEAAMMSAASLRSEDRLYTLG